MNQEERPLWEQKLSGKVDEEILNLKNADNTNMWDSVHETTIKYIARNCIDTPWINHVALIAVVRTSYRNYQPTSVNQIVKALNARFKVLFPVLGINHMDEWSTSHLYDYIDKKVLPEQRYSFLKKYDPASDMINRFYENKLDENQKEKLKSFILPRVYESSFERLGKKVLSQQRHNRKKESEAVVPYFAQMRGEAHFRWNFVLRLRNKYRELINIIEKQNTPLPLTFHYEESDGNLHHFRLWDRRSFIFANKENYSNKTFRNAKERFRAYTDDANENFLEYIKTTDGSGTLVEEKCIWFIDLFENNMIGSSPLTATGQEKDKMSTYFKSFGFVDQDNDESFKTPFRGRELSLFKYGAFMSIAQKFAQGTIFNIEAVYNVCTYGLGALEIFTTTGARMNELQQISLSKECMVVLREEPHPSSSQSKPVKRKLLRLVPKGRIEAENYYIGEETARCINHIVQLLKEQNGESPIPDVQFIGERASLFTDNKPYLFQYYGRHIPSSVITVTIRFLTHGIYLKTDEGKPVLLKAHLLRHAFATHAVQVEKIPVDIVKEWLHQKNVEVTEYYSAPTTAQLATNADIWLTSIATHINVGDAKLEARKN